MSAARPAPRPITAPPHRATAGREAERMAKRRRKPRNVSGIESLDDGWLLFCGFVLIPFLAFLIISGTRP